MEKDFEYAKGYDAYLIPLELCIKPEYYNQHTIPEREDSLVKELQVYELINAITLNENPDRQYVVLDGWKRVEAYRQLGHRFIPATFHNYTFKEEREQHMLLNLQRSQMSLEDMIASLDKLQLTDLGLAEPIYKEFSNGKEAKVPHKITMILAPNDWELHERALREFKQPTGKIYSQFLNNHYNETSTAK